MGFHRLLPFKAFGWLILLMLLLVATACGAGDEDNDVAPEDPVDEAPEIEDEAFVYRAPTQGDPDAPLRVIEFADFQ